MPCPKIDAPDRFPILQTPDSRLPDSRPALPPGRLHPNTATIAQPLPGQGTTRTRCGTGGCQSWLLRTNSIHPSNPPSPRCHGSPARVRASAEEGTCKALLLARDTAMRCRRVEVSIVVPSRACCASCLVERGIIDVGALLHGSNHESSRFPYHSAARVHIKRLEPFSFCWFHSSLSYSFLSVSGSLGFPFVIWVGASPYPPSTTTPSWSP